MRTNPRLLHLQPFAYTIKIFLVHTHQQECVHESEITEIIVSAEAPALKLTVMPFALHWFQFSYVFTIAEVETVGNLTCRWGQSSLAFPIHKTTGFTYSCKSAWINRQQPRLSPYSDSPNRNKKGKRRGAQLVHSTRSRTELWHKTTIIRRWRCETGCYHYTITSAVGLHSQDHHGH